MKTMKHLAPLTLAILLCSATSADQEDGYYPGDPINPTPGVPIDNPHPPNSPPTPIPFDPDDCAYGVGMLVASVIPGGRFGSRFLAGWIGNTVGKAICSGYGPS